MRFRDFLRKNSKPDKFLYTREPKLQKYYYFAYGRNTDLTVMHSHGFCHLVGAGVLPGFHLTFRRFANVERGGRCYGVVWQVDQHTIKMLDIQEGFPYCYTRRFLNVKGVDNKTYEAYVYIMTDSYAKSRADESPHNNYIKHLVRGYERFGCPISQISNALVDSRARIETDKTEPKNTDIERLAWQDDNAI